MILFTGGGAIADAFDEKYECKRVSARELDDKQLGCAISEARVVVHNAAKIHSESLDDYIDSNFLLTKKLLKVCSDVNPKIKFVNIASMSFLGDDKSYMDVGAMTHYAYSKYLAETYCMRQELKNICSVRFSTIFYGDERRDGISKIIREAVLNNEVTIYNNGVAKRDIIPIRIAVMYLHKICMAKSPSKIINVVAGIEHSFMDIVKILLTKNPDLKINNKEIRGHEVLSTFSNNDIAQLGEIDFNLSEEVDMYIEKM